MKPFKKIDENAKERDHIDDTAIEEIQILNASPSDHEYLVGKKILAGEGVSHEVFKEKEKPTEEDIPLATETINTEGEAPLSTQPDIPERILPEKLLITEVVRDPRMKFFRVP